MGIGDPELLAVWEAALSEPLGIKIKTNDVTYCKMRLYRVRKRSNDPRLMELSIITWQDKEVADLGIVRTKTAPTVNPATNLASIDLSGLDLDDE